MFVVCVVLHSCYYFFSRLRGNNKVCKEPSFYTDVEGRTSKTIRGLDIKDGWESCEGWSTTGAFPDVTVDALTPELYSEGLAE